MSDDVSERSQPQSALDATASVGEQGPDLADRARMIKERSTPNQQARTS
jgi:hypothetical protein